MPYLRKSVGWVGLRRASFSRFSYSLKVLGSISLCTISPLAFASENQTGAREEAPPLEFKIKSTVVRELEVVEAPPLTGLPPVEGTITATVHLVEDPKLPDPQPPPVHEPSSPRVPPLPVGANETRSTFIFISATVYDHSRTRLQFHTSGNTNEKVTVWSNIDFNHFCGLAKFNMEAVDGSSRRYDLMMGINNEETRKLAAIAEKKGISYTPPAIPQFFGEQPAFVIEQANPNPEAVQFIENLHQFYRNQGPRLQAAYQARIQAQADRKAYLLANPPKPKDVTMHFWQREHPVGMPADSIHQGGGN
jgi:hypothetical protein